MSQDRWFIGRCCIGSALIVHGFASYGAATLAWIYASIAVVFIAWGFKWWR